MLSEMRFLVASSLGVGFVLLLAVGCDKDLFHSTNWDTLCDVNPSADACRADAGVNDGGAGGMGGAGGTGGLGGSGGAVDMDGGAIDGG